jgi:ubiquinone/menaquinone biosynthesis C-methylase UbiE
MSHREIMGWDAGKADLLDAPDREQEMPAAKVLELLSLKGSETVLDYGAGTGRLAFAVTERLAPPGRVIAIEDSSEMFQLLSERLATVACAEPMLIEGDDVSLPDRTANRILAVDVLHHMRPTTLAEMRRLLAPDGLLLLIDWERGHSHEDGPPDGVLLSPSQAIGELAAAGLQAHLVDSPFAHRYVLLATTETCGPERT